MVVPAWRSGHRQATQGSRHPHVQNQPVAGKTQDKIFGPTLDTDQSLTG
jgi:hypothetical protein